MNDIVSEFRFALRSALLKEDVQTQSTIFFTVVPGPKPSWATKPSESHIRLFGLDRALSRGTKGFLGREWFCKSHPDVTVADKEYLQGQKTCPTCTAPLVERPRGSGKSGAPEELGAWSSVGLPAQTATGYKEPTGWIVFMDWLWELLKSKQLNPVPYEGFGDLDVPYNRLTPNQKRQRKYGKMHKPQMSPGEQLPSALRSLSSTANWPKGFDIEKDITIIIDSIGKDQDEVTRNFQKMLSTVQVPTWMKILPDVEEHRWFVSFQYETDDTPDKYEERRKSIDTYKVENREKWKNAIRKLSGGRTNPAQLAPLVRAWLVAKHGFQRPFHVDVLSQEEFNKAVEIIEKAHLDELVEFAKEVGVAPPVVGADPAIPSGHERQIAIMSKRWVQIINRIAEEGGVEPALIEVALADYLSKYRCGKCAGCKHNQPCDNGFDDPFEFDIASPGPQARAINIVGSLRFDDIRGLLESVQRQVRSLMG